VESINNWISGICKDYPGIIPLGAMHPEHPDPEAEILWMQQPGIKGIKLHGQRPPTPLTLSTGHHGCCSEFFLEMIIYFFTNDTSR
jgi:hypothetical protein